MQNFVKLQEHIYRTAIFVVSYSFFQRYIAQAAYATKQRLSKNVHTAKIRKLSLRTKYQRTEIYLSIKLASICHKLHTIRSIVY